MRGRTRARWALLATLLVPFLAGCPGEVDPNTADPSAPELSLDTRTPDRLGGMGCAAGRGQG